MDKGKVQYNNQTIQAIQVYILYFKLPFTIPRHAPR